MAGNVTVKAGTKVLGVLSASGAINGVPEFFPLGLGIIYKYANLTLPYSPNDPGLQYTYDNSANTPHVTLAARFFNLLNEPSTGVTFDAGSAAAGASVSGIQTDTGPDCLNVLDFGAVGDGVTNDTGPIQCALDQAAKNWNAQQSAIAQGQPLTNPGSTIVCFPSGYTFRVGGGFWQSTCGLAWGTNGNWPNNPYQFAAANLITWDSFFGQVHFGGFGGGPALYVRSGVTIQLDGVLSMLPIAFEKESCMMCIFDDLVDSFQASAVTIKGSGTMDLGGTDVTGGGIGVGFGIIAYVSKNLTIEGITIKNAIHWALQLYNNVAWPPISSQFAGPIFGPQIYDDAEPSSISIDSVTFLDNPLFNAAAVFTAIGCLYLNGCGVSVTNCTFRRCGRTVWMNGKGFDFSNNSLFNCSGQPNLGAQDAIMIGYIDSCTVLNNKIIGGGTGKPGRNPGSAIRLMSNLTPLKLGVNGAQPPTPQYPIDYTLNVQVLGNIVSNYGGFGFNTDPIQDAGQHGGFYSSVKVMNNTFTNCYSQGLNWGPTIWPYVGPGNIAPEGCNFDIDIGGNIYSGNGMGNTRIIFQPPPPASIDLTIGAQVFSVNAYADVSAGIMGALYEFTSAGGGSSFFVGPFCVFPYPNLSTSGTWFVERCPVHFPAQTVTLVNGAPSYIPNDLVMNETPGGQVDGTNTKFTTAHSGITQLTAYQTGVIPGVSPATSAITVANAVATLGSNTFTISPAPLAGSTLSVSYRYSTIEGFVQNTVN